MFSLAAMEVVTIGCHSINPIKIKLNYTGILKLGPGCSLKTNDIIIPATTSQAGKSEFIFESEIHLNLTVISPLLANYGHLLDLSKTLTTYDVGIEPKFSTFEANSKTLDELEQQLQDLALEQHLRGRHQILIYGSYLGVGFLSTILIMYFCRTPIKAIISKLYRILCDQSTSESFDLPTHRKTNFKVHSPKNDPAVYEQISPSTSKAAPCERESPT